MRLGTIRNDAGDSTLTIDDFTKRSYTIGSTSSLIVNHYKRFHGKVLEVYQCDEVMDEDVATRLVDKLVRQYSTPSADVSMASDTGSLTNEGLVEVSVVRVLAWELQNGDTSNPGCERIIIFKKHQRDGYVKAILDLATQLEFGGSETYGSN
ncbi:MAG: hypothetical protein NC114_06525 [Ruminococcus flavefaciens]|nr:hypothetical protein [Ruminococcus flavefaciens]